MTTKRQQKIIRSSAIPRYMEGVMTERRAALISMDREKILAYMRKWNDDPELIALMEADESIFWGGVHKARVACVDLPKYERDKSRRWLKLNNPDAKAAPNE
jgi:hypothetical protein